MTDKKIIEYWDQDYFEYWKKITNMEEGREDVPKDDICNRYIEKLEIKDNEVILDVGCGFGRCFPLFLEKDVKVYGIDISQAMINEAEKIYNSNPKVFLSLGGLEKLDFKNEMFDKILVWAVFDAVEKQCESLNEIARVLKEGGEVLISGKHKPYYEDDSEAKIAEENANKKGHPNFFTDFNELKKSIEKNKLEIENCFIFKKRGDMAKDLYVNDIPKAFYEYIIILKKLKGDQ